MADAGILKEMRSFLPAESYHMSDSNPFNPVRSERTALQFAIRTFHWNVM
jgi:hypothetical protein